ncbi:MAG: hypothetical protein Q9173_001908 [Seirophora scorigena]
MNLSPTPPTGRPSIAFGQTDHNCLELPPSNPEPPRGILAMAEQKTNGGDDYILNRDWRAVASRALESPTLEPALGESVWGIDDNARLTFDSIWPIDIGSELQLPVTVDAIDVSMAQCPPPSWLPKNISLITHDVYEPFPLHMQGVYDLVHVQNWLCIWRDETAEKLISNLLSLLSKFPEQIKRESSQHPTSLTRSEPGGFIQWSEQDPEANRLIVAPGVSCATQATQDVLKFLNAPRQTISFEWVSRLGEYLNAHARLVAFDRFGSSNEHQQLWSIGVLQACEEFASNLERKAQSKADTERAAELRSSAEKAAVEMLTGVAIYSELVVAVAQKGFTKPVHGDSQVSGRRPQDVPEAE